VPDDGPPVPEMYRLIVGAYASQAACVVARLGVADVLAAGPRPVAEIARHVDADERALYRILRALDEVGVVEELEGRRFALTPLGGTLRSDVPGSLRAWAAMIGMRFRHRPWSELHGTVRTGEPAFDRAYGTSLADYLDGRPDDAAAFGAGSAALYTHRNLIGAYDFRRFTTIVHLAGGDGAVLAGILRTNPHLQGVLFSLPDPGPGAADELARAGVLDRCRLASGASLHSAPTDGDVYLLTGMLHGSDDDQAVETLRSCREVMVDTACLLIGETVLPDGRGSSIGKLMDLQTLVFSDRGRLRTETEFRTVLAEAGLHLVRTVPASPMVSLLETVPC
jgi:hypothetical protein